MTYTDLGSGLTYTNLFDQMVDVVIFLCKESNTRISRSLSPELVGPTATILTKSDAIFTTLPT